MTARLSSTAAPSTDLARLLYIAQRRMMETHDEVPEPRVSVPGTAGPARVPARRARHAASADGAEA